MIRVVIAVSLLLAGTILAFSWGQQAGDVAPSRLGQPLQNGEQDNDSESKTDESNDHEQEAKKVKIATFGAGCFWCVEAVFQRLEGVGKIEPGYSNGATENPTYREVCSGLSGHAEVCRIEYDPSKVTYAQLLEVFWKTHDPTTLNQQGADRGTQYRSAIFFHDEEQKQVAEKYKKRLTEADVFGASIVTEITKAEKFYIAEDYHKNYFNDNPDQGYCRAVIIPKLEKFEKAFADKLKKPIRK